MFFCIAVGFLLSVCCYVKLIKHLFFTLLLLFGLSFSIIYVKRAMTFKHLLTKVKAVSFRLWSLTLVQAVSYIDGLLITSMKQLSSFQCYDQLSLHISCFNTCRLLYNKLRIGINISALAIMTLSIRRITLGYAIYLSNIKVSELGVTCIKYQCVMFTYLQFYMHHSRQFSIHAYILSGRVFMAIFFLCSCISTVGYNIFFMCLFYSHPHYLYRSQTQVILLWRSDYLFITPAVCVSVIYY